MSRYQPPSGTSQTETQPGSGGRVLKNLLGITRVREMDIAEFAAYAIFRERSLDDMTAGRIGPRLTAQIVCDWHRDWLGEIYPWAGAYRVVDLAKGNFRWPPAQFVATSMRTLETELLARHTPCPVEAVEQTARRMAEVHAELLFIHPFREGNGRLARWLASIMAMQAGHTLPEYHVGKTQGDVRGKRYIAAVGQGYIGNYEPLTRFFVEAIRAGVL